MRLWLEFPSGCHRHRAKGRLRHCEQANLGRADPQNSKNAAREFMANPVQLSRDMRALEIETLRGPYPTETETCYWQV